MHIKRSARSTYISGGLILLIIEISIAAFVQDKFIRPYLGDFLVVILLYCFLMAVATKISVLKALLLVLIFSFTIEFLQLVDIVKVLQYQPPKFVMIVLGSSFSFWDLLAYTLGILFIAVIENYLLPTAEKSKK